MPFKSEAQRRYMFAEHPKIAKRWAKHTPKDSDLPEHVEKSEREKTSSFDGCFSKIASFIIKGKRPVQ